VCQPATEEAAEAAFDDPNKEVILTEQVNEATADVALSYEPTAGEAEQHFSCDQQVHWDFLPLYPHFLHFKC